MLSRTVSRHSINPNFKWYQDRPDGSTFAIDYNEICAGIDQWKNILVEQCGFQPGHKLGIATTVCDIRYITALFAGIELGGEILVMDRPDTPETVNSVRCRVFAPIDVFIYQDDVAENIMSVGRSYARQMIPMNTWFEYSSPALSGQSKFDITPTTKILSCTTSGTTGVPKILSYNHELFDFLIKRNSKIFEWGSNDRVMHMSNLHHGGSVGVFFFPTVWASEHHYVRYALGLEDFSEVVEYVKKNKINKIMFPHGYGIEKFLSQADYFEHDLDLFCLQANSKSYLPHLRRTNVRSITSFFGSNETMGPLFVNSIRRDSGDDFNVLNYGKPLPEYQIELMESNCLSVDNPLIGHYESKDRFQLDEHGNYIFDKRLDRITINDVELEFGFFESLTNEFFEVNSGYIIPDTVTNKIYLICDPDRVSQSAAEEKLAQINTKLQAISTKLKIVILDFQSVGTFFDAIKFSQDKARHYIRKKYVLV